MHHAGRNRELGAPIGMEIRILELSLRTVERFVGMTPRIIRCIAAAFSRRHGNSRRERVAGPINDG